MGKGYTYITANKNKTVLYVGATNDIKRRILQHKTKTFKNSFTARYNCDILVYFEEFDTVKEAFDREAQLKKGNRKRKEKLINSINPDWNDLSLHWKNENFELENRNTK